MARYANTSSNTFLLPYADDPYTWNGLGEPGRAIPSTLNDGSYIVVTGSNVILYNSSGTAVWTKTPSQVNASATNFFNCAWVDTSDSAIWVLAYNSSTAPNYVTYFAKMALSNGSITAVGSGYTSNIANYSTNDGFGMSIFRNAMGSGDFTVYYMYQTGSSSVGCPHTFNFSSSSGSITVADTVASQNGVQIYNGANSAAWGAVSYRSSDATILLGQLGSSPMGIPIARGGRSAFIPISGIVPGSTAGSFFSFTVAGTAVVPVYQNGSTPAARVLPVWKRTTFDAWLAACATQLGI